MEARSVLWVAGGIVLALFLARFVFGFVLNIFKGLIALVCFAALLYGYQGYKIYAQERSRIKKSYDEGFLTKKGYEAELKKNSLSAILKDPRAVIFSRPVRE